MAESSFNFDDSGLRNLLKAMGEDHVVRVGVFGGSHKEAGEERKIGSDQGRAGGRKASNKASGMTNAEVGFLLEYGRPGFAGKPNIPARSWLRMPLVSKMQNIVKESAKFFQTLPKTGDSLKFMTVIGVSAEKWIGLAFDTRGFGSWAANAPSTIAAKGSDTPGIDTAQLRRAVTSMVV